jgi:uncharacterized membrane protein
MSLRKAINHHCLKCVYDKLASGTWLQQVFLCSVKSCALYDARPKPTRPIPESVLSCYGVSLAEPQALITSLIGADDNE